MGHYRGIITFLQESAARPRTAATTTALRAMFAAAMRLMMCLSAQVSRVTRDARDSSRHNLSAGPVTSQPHLDQSTNNVPPRNFILIP